MKKVSMCVTGHRPDKLVGGYNYENNQIIKENMVEVLHNFFEKNPTIDELTCYSGMALGIDMLFADAVLTVREELGSKIKLICAIPFENQSGNWISQDDVEFHKVIQEFADEVVVLEGHIDSRYGYYLNKRNHYMVDNSDFVLAYWNGSSGGTGNCVEYARKKGKTVIVKEVGILK